ncbi:MAG: prepilin-type N-terminal cleavage/methylation domain-containing protein [Acidobacteriota bacterium]|jgi:prepilin-type N-terminal cleavage/methylation domain-containing protein|nr:prepilin-type N-terminal cleavage/methylation domain-containing protein [Acidobacteriota bacterium]
MRIQGYRGIGDCEPGTDDGFTLLELLVAVVLLSAMAWMTLGLVADDVNQARYEDTRNRLRAIRAAVLGSPALMENGLVGGFVADNGRLPSSIAELSGVAEALEPFGPKAPVFDPTPDAKGFDNGDEPGEEEADKVVELGGARQLLMKGHRGFYLDGGAYRDGWGNRSSFISPGVSCPSPPGVAFSDDDGHESDDGDDNYGWCVTRKKTDDDGYTELYVASYGMDGVEGTTTCEEGDATPVCAYEEDAQMSPPILEADWRTPVPSIEVSVVSRGGGGIPSSDTPWGVALLVYVSDAGDDDSKPPPGRWRQWFSDTASTAAHCADGRCDFDFVFAGGETSPIPQIPMGEHLLALFEVDGAAKALVKDGDEYVTARVKFFPRGGVPTARLAIQ